jgi:hypothetical protein
VNSAVQRREAIGINGSEGVDIDVDWAANCDISSRDGSGTATLSTAQPKEVKQQGCEEEDEWTHDDLENVYFERT